MRILPKIFSLLVFLLFFMILGASHHIVEAAEPAGMRQETASWQVAPNASSYNIYYKEAGEVGYTHAVTHLPANASRYTIGYLKTGVNYWYNVAAVDGSGKEYWWSGNKLLGSGMAVSLPKAVSKPMAAVGGVGISKVIAGNSSATASWSTQTNASSYNVYYRESGEKNYTHSVPNVPAAGSSIQIGYLKNGVGYYYNVAAVVAGKEQWLGEKVLVWPIEVVTVNEPTWIPMQQTDTTNLNNNVQVKSTNWVSDPTPTPMAWGQGTIAPSPLPTLAVPTY